MKMNYSLLFTLRGLTIIGWGLLVYAGITAPLQSLGILVGIFLLIIVDSAVASRKKQYDEK